MKQKKLGVILVGLCVMGVSSFANADDTQTITYKNQRGSVMQLVWHPGQQQDVGTLTGTFKTAVGCKEAINNSMPITGFYSGNAVTMSVNFPACKAVVAMVGNVSENKSEIDTMWLDTRMAKGSQQGDWNAVITGSDHYKTIS